MNKIVIAFIILFIPSLGYFLLRTGKNHYKPLPYFHNRHHVPSFVLMDQMGHPFSTHDVQGSVYVASFFFTRCPDVCPKLNANIDSLVRLYGQIPDIKFISVTVDPAFDTPDRLRAYAAKYKAVAGKWSFLTGSQPAIYHLAHEGYLLDAPAGTAARPPDSIFHSQFVSLIDRKGFIRGYYNGTDEKDILRLKEDLWVLKIETDKSNGKANH